MNGGNTVPAGDRLDHILTTAGREHASRPAVVDGGRTTTYAQLAEAVDGTARRLAALGIRAGTRVGLMMSHGADATIALFALLRLGAVAAPLQPGDPPARLTRMVTGGRLSHVLTRSGARLALAADAPPATRIGDQLDCHALGEPGPAGEGGIVLFTSGSTGVPKGVLLNDGNVLHFVRWVAAEFRLGPHDRVGAQSPLTFDLSTFDIFATALAGACAVQLPEHLRGFPRDVVAWLAEQRITVFYAVPTLYHLLLNRGGLAERPPADLRIAAFAGEPFAPDLLAHYLRLLPGAAFYNLYGPTETNVCTWERIPPQWTTDEPITIGRPLPGMAAVLLDEAGGPADEGELFVSGPSVLRGYLEDGTLRDPARPVLFPDGTRQRAYPTGDRARRLPDGRLLLLGRRDGQVKRRGIRIELADVEAALRAVPGVDEGVVVQKTGPHAGQLWAYVRGAEAQVVLTGLAGVLPRRMLPDRVVPLDRFPTTPHGKTDRRALAAATFPGGEP